jgi:sporadic carbohydrate cluster protein (TIGR04323 family)
MKKIKRFAGYINLKPINGVLYPSSIQNILLKNYVTDFLKGKFYLSPTEVLQAQNLITLNTLISDEVKVNGIVMLSIFFLPFQKKKRDILYKRTLNNKKELHFILDEIIFKDRQDVKKIEESLIFRNNFFTETRFKTNNFEQKMIKSFRTSFV